MKQEIAEMLKAEEACARGVDRKQIYRPLAPDHGKYLRYGIDDETKKLVGLDKQLEKLKSHGLRGHTGAQVVLGRLPLFNNFTRILMLQLITALTCFCKLAHIIMLLSQMRYLVVLDISMGCSAVDSAANT